MSIVAFVYDFDDTLTPHAMQEYGFMRELGMTPERFWAECAAFQEEFQADGILSYMAVTLRQAAKAGVRLHREDFLRMGRSIQFYPGVVDWFGAVNRYGAAQGLECEHYILSSGQKELIEGSAIAEKFTAIFADSFCYDREGEPFWPATAINYTAKTQYLFRINKGILDITNDRDLNAFTPEEKRRVPFANMLYIGDGYTDVPCMKMIKQKGGTAIAVYGPGREETARALLTQRRAHYALPADYTMGGDMWNVATGIIDDIAERARETR